MKRYKITTPTPERCIELGVKFEGINMRTNLWLQGVAQGTSFFQNANRFNVFFTTRQHTYVETNCPCLIQGVTEFLSQYGYTVEESPYPTQAACIYNAAS